MPTEVFFYRERDSIPAMEWYLEQPKKVQDKFTALIVQLREKGSTLSRPHAAPLAEKIYELRVRHLQVNYRLLYFFAPNAAAVITHGCTKEDVVDRADIKRAVERRQRYLADPAAHTHFEQD